jgi:hypothetical protein
MRRSAFPQFAFSPTTSLLVRPRFPKLVRLDVNRFRYEQCCPAVTVHPIRALTDADQRDNGGKGFGRPPSNPTPKQNPASRKTNVDAATSASYKKSSNDPSASFVPRGPTMREDYIDRGMMAPDSSPEDGILPQAVADRMIRRIAGFAGVPLASLFLFFAAYFIARYKYDIRIIPVFVAYTTLGCIGAAGVGITYGIMSSSWDEDDEGSRLGWKESKINFMRARDGLASVISKERRAEARMKDLNAVNKWREEKSKKGRKDKGNP